MKVIDMTQTLEDSSAVSIGSPITRKLTKLKKEKSNKKVKK